MFKLTPDPHFTVKVPLSVPGQADAVEIDIEFRHKTKEALASWEEAAGTRSDEDILADIIQGWSGPVDANGVSIPYSRAALAQLLRNYGPAGREIFTAYLSELRRSKRKNF